MLALIAAGFVSAVLANEVAVRLNPQINPISYATRNGCVYIGPVAGLTNYHLLECPSEDSLHHNAAREAEQLEWQEVQRRIQRVHRGILYDSLEREGDLWHLEQFPGLDVRSAWSAGLEGDGIVISIVDDGVDDTHPDLREAYSAEYSYDVIGRRKKVYLSREDTHGTPAAGLAASRASADSEGFCAIGTSPKARVAGVRLITRPTTDAEEAQGISYGAPHVDVYSASWGPLDDGRRLEGPGHLSREALEAVVAGHPLHPHLHGRGGLGSIYVWAAGNGGRNGDMCSYDGWANSRFTITVGAITDQGKSPTYSEQCSAVLVSAPSSGGHYAITTTAATTGFRCTNQFGGTSASAPLIAGVVALILNSNPKVTWRDVQHILVHSSSLGEHAADVQVNGGALSYSHALGFGVPSATQAVQLASTWTNVGPARSVEYYTPANLTILENERWYRLCVEVEEQLTLEHVEVVFSAKHERRGDLYVALVGPFGTRSRFAEVHSDEGADYNEWRFMSVAYWDSPSSGSWCLEVRDPLRGVVGAWTSWSLVLWGR